jgi:hypothetical protein
MFTRIALAAALLGLSGCYASAYPAVGVSAEYDGYDPQYYEGNVIYYDTVGSPYYVIDGRPRYVARTHPYYRRYVTHYHRYRPGYQRWVTRHVPHVRPEYRAYDRHYRYRR